jgi:hypothetical protein
MPRYAAIWPLPFDEMLHYCCQAEYYDYTDVIKTRELQKKQLIGWLTDGLNARMNERMHAWMQEWMNAYVD